MTTLPASYGITLRQRRIAGALSTEIRDLVFTVVDLAEFVVAGAGNSDLGGDLVGFAGGHVVCCLCNVGA